MGEVSFEISAPILNLQSLLIELQNYESIKLHYIIVHNTYIHKVAPFPRWGRQRLHRATCYDYVT